MGTVGDQLGLSWLTLIVAAVVFVGVEALLVVAALRLRRGETAAGAAPPSRWRVSWGRELVWTLLPALGLLVLGLLGAQAVVGGRPAGPPPGTPTPVAARQAVRLPTAGIADPPAEASAQLRRVASLPHVANQA
jgi:heme/copper-type cytochrome/quinol oxidase subunit 2